jgi:hypothetical protein
MAYKIYVEKSEIPNFATIKILHKQYMLVKNMMDQDSSVSTVTGYELDRWGSIPGRGKTFYLLQSIQTGSRAH